MNEILIRVTSHHDDYYGDDIKQEQVTVEQLMDEQGEYLLKSRGYAKIDPKGKINRETVELLRKFGWVHAETAASREDKKVVEQEFYLLDEQVNNYRYGEAKFCKIDLDNLTDDQLKRLARSAKIVQCVAPKSVLPQVQYKKLQTKRKQLEDMRGRTKEMAEKKAAKKKEREIAAAKKLLEEAGLK